MVTNELGCDQEFGNFVHSKNSKHMKYIFLILISALVAFACSSKQDEKAAKQIPVVANKTIHLAVDGMTCEGCENTVKEAVGAIDGVTEVAASHTAGTTDIIFDSTLTDIKAISAAITDAGYIVKGEKSDEKSSPSPN
jgi:copper chaperone CopZ